MEGGNSGREKAQEDRKKNRGKNSRLEKRMTNKDLMEEGVGKLEKRTNKMNNKIEANKI